MSKTNPGNFFEDFQIGQVIEHATPRTVTEGDRAVYGALYPTRFAIPSSATFAGSVGLVPHPVEELIGFHIAFGKTVPDISLNAVANLGYAECRFHQPVVPGDTLRTASTVIGLKENSNGKSGVVWVRSTGFNQTGESVLDYCRWVMVRKRNVDAPVQSSVVPDLPDAVQGGDLIVPHKIHIGSYDFDLAGSRFVWDDYEQGEKIDHVDGMTIEEAEHMMATRLYQNTAKVHFDALMQKGSRFGRRLIYGGHIISLARAISFNGLANAFKVAAINGGRHVAPTFAGDTIYAWSEVIAKTELSGRRDVGALRLRTVATKDKPCATFPYKDSAGTYDPAVVLDFDYTVLLPKRV